VVELAYLDIAQTKAFEFYYAAELYTLVDAVQPDA
jgi:hypothetical protein